VIVRSLILGGGKDDIKPYEESMMLLRAIPARRGGELGGGKPKALFSEKKERPLTGLFRKFGNHKEKVETKKV